MKFALTAAAWSGQTQDITQFHLVMQIPNRKLLQKNTLFVEHAHFPKKIRGDFSEYEIGIGHTYYLK